MTVSLEDKKAIVKEVADVAANAHSAIAAEYRGLSVAQMTELRNKAREGGVYVRVVKNTLAKRALEGTDYACMKDGLAGPLLLAFSQDDPAAAARVLKDFSNDHEDLKVKLISIGGRLLEASELKRLAALPTHEQAVSMLMAVMTAPIEKLVRTLAEPQAKLVRAVAAFRDHKQASV